MLNHSDSCMYTDKVQVMRNLDQIMRSEVNAAHGSDSALYCSSGFVLEISSCLRSFLCCTLYVLIRTPFRSSTKASLCTASSQTLIISCAVRKDSQFVAAHGVTGDFSLKYTHPHFSSTCQGCQFQF